MDAYTIQTSTLHDRYGTHKAYKHFQQTLTNTRTTNKLDSKHYCKLSCETTTTSSRTPLVTVASALSLIMKLHAHRTTVT